MEREKADRQVSSMRVLNFGSLNLDYVYNVDRFVRPGETPAASSRAAAAAVTRPGAAESIPRKKELVH